MIEMLVEGSAIWSDGASLHQHLDHGASHDSSYNPQ